MFGRSNIVCCGTMKHMMTLQPVVKAMMVFQPLMHPALQPTKAVSCFRSVLPRGSMRGFVRNGTGHMRA